MKEFGADAAWSSESSISVHPGQYEDIPFTVESDWSGASYWYQMVALSQDSKEEPAKTEVELLGLFPRSYRTSQSPEKLYDGMIFVTDAHPIEIREEISEK